MKTPTALQHRFFTDNVCKAENLRLLAALADSPKPPIILKNLGVTKIDSSLLFLGVVGKRQEEGKVVYFLTSKGEKLAFALSDLFEVMNLIIPEDDNE